METELIQIENKIVEIRGSRVMLDSDLAELYGVPTHRLNEQVKRNNDRFPLDFRFQLTQDEYDSLSSQIASSKKKTGRTALSTLCIYRTWRSDVGERIEFTNSRTD